eukprot:CAMPEP_0198263956 /NCGR_PEP_ID=MMETSP1447-20131203/14102_1 /TAXON_ID=420782 /ORGANISM="Chaetoceros dichaeta, Strain CCMP1751" /LENGTH=45 /DNA_ID= /DNA_START= /DNA_END= /DNA_ORIENTATION=
MALNLGNVGCSLVVGVSSMVSSSSAAAAAADRDVDCRIRLWTMEG